MKIQKVLLCGLRCTGKTTTMWNLQKELNWPVFSASQYLRDYIRQMNIPKEKIAEHHIAMTKDIDERIGGLLGGDNNVIVEARGFAHIERRYEGVLKVLLTAGNHVRFERSSVREQTTLERASKRVEAKDRSFLDSVKAVYGNVNIFDPKFYDLVIDTTHKSKEEVMWMVVRRARG